MFQVGDRVKCVENAPDGNLDLTIGCTGTVRQIIAESRLNIGVEWDENIGGHNLRGNCERGHGWQVSENDIVLLIPEPDDDSPPPI